MNVEDFRAIKQVANGMLSPTTYQKIYEYASRNQGNVVEVGTAHGAATICLAAALQPGAGKVYSFEKILGGSRQKFGSVEQNVRIIQSNYERFHVDDRIKQFIGDVAVECRSIESLTSFSMLVLDADGRLDRDFVLFYDRLVPGGFIVIDDCDDRVKVKLKSGTVVVDQKHKLTHLFIAKLEEMGFLERLEVVENTYFGRKPATPRPISALSVLDISSIYGNLVFCRVNYVELLLKKLRSYPGRVKRKLQRTLAGSGAADANLRR